MILTLRVYWLNHTNEEGFLLSTRNELNTNILWQIVETRMWIDVHHIHHICSKLTPEQLSGCSDGGKET